MIPGPAGGVRRSAAWHGVDTFGLNALLLRRLGCFIAAATPAPVQWARTVTAFLASDTIEQLAGVWGRGQGAAFHLLLLS